MSYSNHIPGKKSNGTGEIIGGVFAILFAGFFVFATISTNNAANELASSPEPPLPQSVPLDVPVLDEYVNNNSEEFLVRAGMKPNITIYFDGRSSIKRLWNGTNAKFQVLSPFTQLIPAYSHSAEWGNLLTSSQPGGKSFTPWVSTTYPMDAEYLHQWITAKASLDITYPANTAALGFTNQNVHLKRMIRFFMITDEEYLLLEAHDRWQDVQGKDGFWDNASALICPVILFTFLGVFLFVMGISENRR